MMPPWLDRAQRTALLITVLLYSAGFATVGLLVVLLTTLLEGMWARRLPWQRSSLDLGLGALLLIMLVAGLASAYRPIATASAGLAALTVFLSYGPAHRVLWREPRALTAMIGWWTAGGIAAGGWALAQHRLRNVPASLPQLGQNAVGTTMLITLILLLGLFLIARPAWAAALGLLAAVPGAALILSYTRGAWIGAAVGVVLLIGLTGVRRARRIGALLALGAVIAVLALGQERGALLARAASIPNLQANAQRVYLLRSGWAIFRDHPLLGTGLNTFATVYRDYRLPGDPNPDVQPFAHNILLNMAAEIGLFGLIAFVTVIVGGLVAAWKWLQRLDTPERRVPAAALLAAFVGAIVHQLFDGTLLSVHLGAGLWILLAVFDAGAARERR